METISLLLSVVLALLVLALVLLAGASFEALLKGCFELRRSLRRTSYNFDSILLKSPIVPGVSMVLAAPGASPETRALVRRLLDLHFGNHEVVLILDDPAEADLACWVKELNLYPVQHVVRTDLPSAPIRGCYVSHDPIRLLVVEKEAGGMADALNAGVNAAQYPVIGIVDREARFIPELLLRLIRPMLGDWNKLMAVCGVAPPPPVPGLASGIAAIEGLRLWLARCAAMSSWNKLVPVPGASMLIQRDAVLQVGGFRRGPLELFLDLHAVSQEKSLGWRVAFLATPVSGRPGATSWSDLRRQVIRDQRQLAAALGQLRPGAGRQFFGLFCVRAVRPVLETAAYVLAAAGWMAGLIATPLALSTLLIGVGGGIVNSMAAVVLRELAESSGIAPGQLTALFLTAIPENLGYRQIRNLWMIKGFYGRETVGK